MNYFVMFFLLQMPKYLEIVLVQKNAIVIRCFCWRRNLFDDDSLASLKKISTHSTGEIMEKEVH